MGTYRGLFFGFRVNWRRKIKNIDGITIYRIFITGLTTKGVVAGIGFAEEIANLMACY